METKIILRIWIYPISSASCLLTLNMPTASMKQRTNVPLKMKLAMVSMTAPLANNDRQWIYPK